MDKVDTIEQKVAGKQFALPSSKRLQRVDRYRSHHNPLRGLTMALAIRLLEEGNRGAYADLQWLYKFAERSYEPLKACKGRMQDALVKLDWNIKKPDDLESPELDAMAEKQRVTLRAEYDKLRNIRQAIKFMATGFFRGYAHLEKHWARDAKGNWYIERLEPVPQWHWVRPGILGDWHFNEDARAGVDVATPVDLRNFVWFEIEDPIDYPGLIRFIRANMAEKDWAGWLEKFGIAHVYAVAPETATDDAQLKEFVDYVDAVMSDSGGALPSGTQLETLAVQGTGADTFEKALTHHEEMVVLAAINSKLTMLAESGSGTLAGGAHQDTWEDVAEARAMDISEVFQEHFDRHILELHHPGEPALAYFELAKEDEKDAAAVIEFAAKAKRAGYDTDEEELTEKSGYKLVKSEAADPEDPEALNPNSKVRKEDEDKRSKKDVLRNRETLRLVNAVQTAGAGDFLGASLERYAAGLGADLAPLRKKIEEAAEAGDLEEMRRLVEAMSYDVAAAFEEIAAGGEAVSAMQDILATSVANGVDDAEAATGGLWNRVKSLFNH